MPPILVWILLIGLLSLASLANGHALAIIRGAFVSMRHNRLSRYAARQRIEWAGRIWTSTWAESVAILKASFRDQ